MTEIACTLTPDRVRDRLALIDGLAGDALIDQERIPGGVRSRFRAAAEPRVRELVDLESQCCGFLDFRIARDGDALAVDITGPADAQPVIEKFFGPSSTHVGVSR